MSLLTALLDSYDYALEHDMVGKPDAYGNILLPMFCKSEDSNGKNILEVIIDKKGQLIEYDYVAEGETIIFPVTEDSAARSSNVAPHPIVDNMSYIVQDGGPRNQAYMAQLESWLDYEEIEYIRIIYDFLKKDKIIKRYYESLLPDPIDENLKKSDPELAEEEEKKRQDKIKKIKQTYITFTVAEYDGKKNLSVSDNHDLQEKYRDYFINRLCNDKEKIICNLSGKPDYLCFKHQPLIGRARLVSQIKANEENYKGRFTIANQNIALGVETSQKIHLMAKYLLMGKNTHTGLAGNAIMITWFSDDIQNESEASIEMPIQAKNLAAIIKTVENDMQENRGLSIADEMTKEIVKSFTNGNPKFTDGASYYVAILDNLIKGKGRVMLKYFKELSVSRLKANLYSWHEKYHWYRSGNENRNINYTPSLKQIILAAYGIEREDVGPKKEVGLETPKKAFYNSQYQNLVTALIEGRDIPANFERAFAMNIRNRMYYDKTWEKVKFCALAVLNNKGGFESAMLKRDNTDRSYLFGRLLALFEQMEEITYEKDKERATHAQKLWTTYTNNPAVTMLRLRKLLNPYEIKLAKSESLIKQELYADIKKEMTSVTNMLSEHYDFQSRDMSRPLDYNFIFGYEAQRRSVQSKRYKLAKQVEEEEEQNDQQ